MKNGLVALSLLVVALGSCRPAATPSEHCRRQNTARRVGRSMNPDPRLDAIEDLRCQQLEVEERQQARENAQHEQVEASARAIRDAELDAKLASIRRSPKTPELGSTTAEGRLLCDQQRGVFLDEGNRFACRVGGPVIFTAVVAEGRVRRTSAFFEGTDVTQLRDTFAVRFGPPEREAMSDQGYRVFFWEQGNVALTSYERGARLTIQTEEK